MFKLNKEINAILIVIIIGINLIAFFNDYNEKDFLYILKFINFPLFSYLAFRFYTNNHKILFFVALFFVVIYGPLNAWSEMALPAALFLAFYFSLRRSLKIRIYKDEAIKKAYKLYECREVLTRYILISIIIATITYILYICFF